MDTVEIERSGAAPRCSWLLRGGMVPYLNSWTASQTSGTGGHIAEGSMLLSCPAGTPLQGYVFSMILFPALRTGLCWNAPLPRRVNVGA
jgi:hypothetical protein